MKQTLKHIFLLVARTLGAFHLARYLTRKEWRILAYHGIWLGPDHFGNHLFMQADTFRRRMQLIRDRGYPVVSLATLLDDGAHENAPVAITIDDGWRGTYKHMLPALEQAAFPATLYLYTAYVDSQQPVASVTLRYLIHRTARRGVTSLPYPPGPEATTQSLDAIAAGASAHLQALANDDQRDAFLDELAAALGEDLNEIRRSRWLHLMTGDEVSDAQRRGLDIQLHTHDHRTSVGGEDVLGEEIERNRQRILAMTGKEADQFCYPSGVFVPENFPVLASLGVRSATTTEQGLAGPHQNPFALPRIMDGEDVSELEFEAELSGFMSLLRRGLRGPAATT